MSSSIRLCRHHIVRRKGSACSSTIATSIYPIVDYIMRCTSYVWILLDGALEGESTLVGCVLGDSWATPVALHDFLLVRVPAICVAMLSIPCGRGFFSSILGGVCKSHRSREIGAAPLSVEDRVCYA